jgi:uncharacterized membrane protein (DUF2068 family)
MKRIEKAFGFRLIGAFKLLSGVLFLGVGFGLPRLFDGDVATRLERAISLMRLDPDNHFVHSVISRVAGINRHQLHQIQAGTFFYALLHLVEGTGLVLGYRWAGFLTVVATSSLIPFEAYTIWRKFDFWKLAVLAANVAIVVYVIIKLRKEMGDDAAS